MSDQQFPRIQAIPTMYSGVQFRSRLEAKWAAFFDACSWKWDYEPVDFAGYIPDFRIGKTLFEVKPFEELCKATARKIVTCAVYGEKMDRDKDFVVLMDKPRAFGNIGFIRQVGWRIKRVPGIGRRVGKPDFFPQPVIIYAMLSKGGGVEIGKGACAQYGENPILFTSKAAVIIDDGTTIDDKWKLAINATQWRGERA